MNFRYLAGLLAAAVLLILGAGCARGTRPMSKLPSDREPIPMRLLITDFKDERPFEAI
ncbi:hypothetical protein HZA57_05200, partial [Candidatus Poribacteria bacterium]|nr:hypothetical protein [Candidatus Poribacteria bacterium]